jgi:hypothetical protein
MVFPNSDRLSFFNKFTTTLYSSGKGVRRVISMPFAYTVVTQPGKTRSRFFPGDIDIYFAARTGWIEPRIGLEIPCGYAHDDQWKKKPWIGPNNIRLQTGFSISRTDFEQIGLPFGLETTISFALTDDNAQYKKGSIGTQFYLKSSRTYFKKYTVGGELAVYGKSITWQYNNQREHGLTILPAVFSNYRFFKKIYIGAKWGFGPSFKLDHGFIWKSNACDIGAGILYFP